MQQTGTDPTMSEACGFPDELGPSRGAFHAFEQSAA